MLVRRTLFAISLVWLRFGATLQAQSVTWAQLSQLSGSPIYQTRAATPFDSPLRIGEPPDTVVRQIKPTHWKEGGLVGALVVGVLGAWFGSEICKVAEDGDSGCAGLIVGGALGGAGTGFLIGALIGGQFPKHPEKAAESP
jgi:hypothetical protein